MDNSALSQSQWKGFARGLIRSELIRRNIDAGGLAEIMRSKGIGEYSPEQVKTRLSRGEFSTVFLLQALCALDVSQIELRHIHRRINEESS